MPDEWIKGVCSCIAARSGNIYSNEIPADAMSVSIAVDGMDRQDHLTAEAGQVGRRGVSPDQGRACQMALAEPLLAPLEFTDLSMFDLSSSDHRARPISRKVGAGIRSTI